jgi:hypothetical protein
MNHTSSHGQKQPNRRNPQIIANGSFISGPFAGRHLDDTEVSSGFLHAMLTLPLASPLTHAEVRAVANELSRRQRLYGIRFGGTLQ